MDYKYIEQLLERYWNCMTSREEEQILRSFFCQKNIPAEFADYAPLFAYEAEAAKQKLSDSFDNKLEAAIKAEELERNPQQTTARVVTMKSRIAPLLKAVAAVAVIFTIGTATEQATMDRESLNQGNEPAIITNPYIRTAEVEAVINPQPSMDVTTATAQTTDSLTRSQIVGDMPLTSE